MFTFAIASSQRVMRIGPVESAMMMSELLQVCLRCVGVDRLFIGSYWTCVGLSP